MIFAIESIAACLLFTLMFKIATAKRSEVFVNDYPPVVTDKLRAMRLKNRRYGSTSKPACAEW